MAHSENGPVHVFDFSAPLRRRFVPLLKVTIPSVDFCPKQYAHKETDDRCMNALTKMTFWLAKFAVNDASTYVIAISSDAFMPSLAQDFSDLRIEF